MTTDQINTLAREYAIEVTKDMAKNLDESSCLLNETINQTTEYCSEFLQWLSERFCIVEKSKLEDIAFRAKHYNCVILMGSEVKELFPELFKDEEQ